MFVASRIKQHHDEFLTVFDVHPIITVRERYEMRARQDVLSLQAGMPRIAVVRNSGFISQLSRRITPCKIG